MVTFMRRANFWAPWLASTPTCGDDLEKTLMSGRNFKTASNDMASSPSFLENAHRQLLKFVFVSHPLNAEAGSKNGHWGKKAHFGSTPSGAGVVPSGQALAAVGGRGAGQDVTG